MNQTDALKVLKMGHNVFLTGEAGSGKTYVLNKYIDWCRKHDIEVAVTASTGIAATHLEGRTIHSWSGIGIKSHITDKQLEELEQNQSVWNRINDADVLVIDEVSMLSADVLETVARVTRQLRRKPEPFGGLQVVLAGDFFQLPPVTKGDDLPRYAFESRVWRDLNPVICYLTQQFRHTNEDTLFQILSAIRGQEDKQAIADTLQGRLETSPDAENLTRLFTHNVDVDTINQKKLRELDGNASTFEMDTKGRQNHVDSLKRGALAKEELKLKEGAEVMFIKNDTAGKYVNGTRGRIIDIKGSTPIVKTKNGQEITVTPADWQRRNDGDVTATVTQIPLRLAWAITVHKSQGMTLDAARMDLGKSFVPGQGYVALSRVRSLDGLHLKGFNETALAVDSRVAARDERFRKKSALAADRLKKLDDETIQDHHEDFITTVDGSLEEVEIDDDTPAYQYKGKTYDITKTMLEDRKSISEIANERDLSETTVWKHLETLQQQNRLPDINHIDFSIQDDDYTAIAQVINEQDSGKLKPIRQSLKKQGVNVSYDTLRKARILIREE